MRTRKGSRQVDSCAFPQQALAMFWRFDLRLFLLCLVAVCALGTHRAWAEPPTADHRQQIKQAEAALKRAGNYFRARKYTESGQEAREAYQMLSDLPADDSKAWQDLLDPLKRQLTKARELLAAHQVRIPAWRDPGSAAATQVSFVKEVAPVLLAKCGGCHVQKAEGELSMRSFEALAKGSASGVVLMEGDAAGSRIIELIESGDMPRGGGEVTPKELATLKDWIDGGAKFDGLDPAADITGLVPGAMPVQAPAIELASAGSNDEVQFARDIGPILLEHCLECHGDVNGGNGFSLNSFNRLLRGGGNGPPFVLGMPAESLLIQKLRGTAAIGSRMPQGRDPLPEEAIAKIERWIELGGKFDGFGADLTLDRIVAQVEAGKMTHEELSKQRVELAEKTWHLILPDRPAEHLSGKDVLVVGSVDEETMASVVQIADEQVVKLRKVFKLPADQPLIKGRFTLFVFDKRYDYGEVGTMLERRELPLSWRGHWTYNPLDPYGCILLNDQGEAEPGLVAQQITGMYVASLGEVPRWFSEGSARAIASRLDPKDPRIKQWDTQVADVLGKTEKPEDFLAGSLPPEDTDVLSYSFVSKFLMAPATRYLTLLTALQSGTSFDEAFAKSYGDAPDKVVPNWTTRVSRRRR